MALINEIASSGGQVKVKVDLWLYMQMMPYRWHILNM